MIPLADAPYYRITSRCLPKALASAKALASLMGWAPLMGQALPKAFRGAGSTSCFFCGVDHYSGQSCEHRRQWVVDRIVLLSSLIAIDVCTYAVMSNHYHLGLKLFLELLNDLSDGQIMDRWWAIDPIDPDQVT